MRTIAELLREHTFFTGLSPHYIELIAGCGHNQRFAANQHLAKEGNAADYFFVIQQGKVAIETHVPQRGSVTLQTLKAGDVAGWSWIFPPYRWVFDAKATEPTLAIVLDGKCLRQKCEETPQLGYDLMKRFARIMAQRLQATRLQLLDVYGKGNDAYAHQHIETD